MCILYVFTDVALGVYSKGYMECPVCTQPLLEPELRRSMRLKLTQIPESVDKGQDSGQSEQIGLVLFMFPQKKGSGSVTLFSLLLLLKYR